jgi:hypothetical protein
MAVMLFQELPQFFTVGMNVGVGVFDEQRLPAAFA